METGYPFKTRADFDFNGIVEDEHDFDMVPSGKGQNIRVFSLLTSLSGDFSGSVHKTAKHLLTLTIKGHYEFSFVLPAGIV